MAQFKQLSATNLVKSGAGKLKGILVTSTSSGTLKAYNSLQGSTSDPVIFDTLTPSAGTLFAFPDDGIFFDHGLYIVAANTISFTVIFD